MDWILIVFMLIAILIFLGILKLMNKWVFKNKVKITWKEIGIGWCIIFGINVFSVIANIPIAIGIPYHPFGDCGATTLYVSLGYVVYVEKDIFSGDEKSTIVQFLTLKNEKEDSTKLDDAAKIQKGYQLLGYDTCKGHTSITPMDIPSQEDKCIICENKKGKVLCSSCAYTTNRCDICGKLKN